jgi:hypothetical protein
MNAEDCNVRAAACAANAALTPDEAMSAEFLKLAAQWRAMAVRYIYLGSVDGPLDVLQALNALPPPAPPGLFMSPVSAE